MSDSAKEKELADVELCYKAMGLSFSDPPDQVERVYRKLKDDCGKAMRTGSPAERVQATENLKQLEELFETITNSLIYKDYAREYEKYKQIKAEQMAARKQKQEQKIEKEELVKCPYCQKPISAKLKVCLYCHGKILTPMERLIGKVFTRTNIIIMTTALIILVIGVLYVTNPSLFKM